MADAVYLLTGPETGKRDDYIADLEKKLKRSLGEPPEKYKYYSFDTAVPDIISLLKNGSLFSSHKLVLIMNVDEYKKKDMDSLLEYVKKPAESSTLILVSEKNKLDRLDKAVPAKNKVVFWEMFDNQKNSWVQSYFSKSGKKISGDAIETLLDMVENNTNDLKIHCERLVQFTGAENLITSEIIEKVLYHSKEENVFTLFEKLGQKDLEASLETVQKIILSGDGNGIGLISGLLWQWKKLMMFKFFSSRMDSTEALYKAGIRGKKNQANYKTASRNYSQEKLEQIIVLTTEFDARLRQVRSEMEPVLLQYYLYKLIKNPVLTEL